MTGQARVERGADVCFDRANCHPLLAAVASAGSGPEFTGREIDLHHSKRTSVNQQSMVLASSSAFRGFIASSLDCLH